MHKNLEKTISTAAYAVMGIDNLERSGSFRERYGVIENKTPKHMSSYAGIDNLAFKPLYADMMHCVEKAMAAIDGIEAAAE
jgi:hypothetical protein